MISKKCNKESPKVNNNKMCNRKKKQKIIISKICEKICDRK